ncbi:Hypothetical protein RG1141_CH01440 [Neorhizobium galegae bv. officinalis bv. officinalis str. HAMBI 1141]|uniref:Uncharacterized protein n=1 Tax=Neorhizobium galegae bv. officinalis bv. officinalis str. HAMBI 1141 TaxID=1028801 RepID=A0A068T336_NEOGA|nr:hypothetical protein [Neorhizobium galegae]CDN52509.1 Hypothetical protein RG1141_CH01440 [Neorhizobium galegae bv. officinalis bv. officinalis str. HAMBI 1141]
MRQQIQNHNAYPLCRNRDEQVACVAEAMRRLGEGCTSDDLKSCLGITEVQLKAVADDARARAVTLSTVQTRISVPALRAGNFENRI